MTGADLNAMEERLLAQLAGMKPPALRLMGMFGRVDGWITAWLRSATLNARQPASWG